MQKQARISPLISRVPVGLEPRAHGALARHSRDRTDFVLRPFTVQPHGPATDGPDVLKVGIK